MSQPRKPSFLRRLLLGGALGTGALLVVVAALLAWLLGTAPGAAFVLERAAALAGAKVAGVEGRLAGPLVIDSFALDLPASRVRLRRLALDWSPLALLAGEVRIDRLHAGSLEVDTAPSTGAAKPPATLVPPFKVRVAQAGLDRLRVGTLGEEGGVELRELSAKLAGEAGAWIVGDAQALTPLGRARAAGTLGARAPFALDLKGELAGERRGAPYALSLEAKGSLSQVALAFSGKEGGLAGRGTAAVEPFATVPLRGLVASLSGLDLSAFAAAPRTRLAIEANLVARAGALLAGPVRIANAEPGPLDKGLVPVATLEADIALREGRIDAERLAGTFAPGGRAEGRATWAGGRLDAKLVVKGGNLLSWHTALRPTQLAGEISAVAGEDAQSFTVDLAEPRFSIAGDVAIAQGRVTVGKARLSRGNAVVEAGGSLALGGARDFDVRGRVEAFDPAAFARVPAGDLHGRFEARGTLANGVAGELLLEIEKSRFAGLAAEGRAHLAGDRSRLARAEASLSLGATRLTARGALGREGDALEARLASPDLGPLGRAFGVALGGRVDVEASLAGTFAAPSGRGTVAAENLALPGDWRVASVKGRAQLGAGDAGAVAGTLEIRGVTSGSEKATRVEQASLGVRGTRALHEARLDVAFPEGSTLQALLDGGFLASSPAAAWRGQLASLDARGRADLALAAPAPLFVSAERIELGATHLAGETGVVRLALTRWTPAGIEARGTSQGVVLRALARALGVQPQAGSNLVLAGQWDLRLGESVDGFVAIERERGDLRLGEPRQALGLDTVSLRAEATAGRVTASARIHGTKAGRWQADGAATIRRGEQGWEISPVAPLDGRFDVDVPDLSWTAAWLGAEARAAGRLKAQATLAGTTREPAWSGRLDATGLALRDPTLGAEVGDGTVAITFRDHEARIETFELSAPWTPGAEAAKALAGVKRPPAGTLTAEGAMNLATRQGIVRLKAAAYPLTRLATRFLAVSGAGRIELDGANALVAGDFAVDAGWFGIPAAAPPSLSDDVIVERGTAQAPRSAERVRLDLRVNLGDNLHFRGRGLVTRLAGNLRLAGDVGGALRTTGTIRAVGGTFDAYGRTLAIERGALNFQGPLDNPGLNVLALRKGLPVEAGVEVLGTVGRPKARLVSTPDVPDPEKLSWLVLGRGQGEVSATDAATLVTAANAILGRDALPSGKILRGIGFDELRLGRDDGGVLGTLPQSTVAGKTGTTSTADVVTVGKRLTDDIYVSYRQGLADAEGSLRVAWQFTKSLQFILRAGYQPGVDAVYRFSLD